MGVDSKTKAIHSAVVTAANIADSAVLPDLLHGDETNVWGDQAYRGQSEAIHEVPPRAQDLTNKRYRYKDRVDEVEREKNRTKAHTRQPWCRIPHRSSRFGKESRWRESHL